MKFMKKILLVFCIYLRGSSSYSGKWKGDLFMSYENPSPGTVLVRCAYCSDDRQAAMDVGEHVSSDAIQVNTYVSNTYDAHGKCYLVTTQLLVLDALLQHQTTFECALKNTLTGEVKNTSMVYVRSSAWRPVILEWLLLVTLVLDVLLQRWS